MIKLKHNVPKRVLKKIIGEDYFIGNYTLEQELSRYEEDVLYADYEFDKKGQFIYFNAWTKSFVMFLNESAFGDGYLLALSRTPDIYKKRKADGK